MGDEQARRLAANEATMRDINEEIEGLAAAFAATPRDEHVYVFLCECSRETCTTGIRMTAAEYEHVRERPERFALVPGHENAAIERVVETHEHYVIVEKVGPGAAVARERDRRAAA